MMAAPLQWPGPFCNGRATLGGLGLPYSTMELPEVGERAAFPAHAHRRPSRTDVPNRNLGVIVEKLVVAGDMMTVHMVFTGHFTGTFGKVKGTGQPIHFIATDLLKTRQRQIADNWHIEDNLMLLQQMGVAKLAA